VQGASADVEVIALGDRFARERGLSRFALRLNSIGDSVCRPGYRDELVRYFEPHVERLDDDCRARLRQNPLRVFDCKVDGEKDFVLAAPKIADRLCDPCAAHFIEVRNGLESAAIPYELDPRLVRGLDYYTRTAFEFVSSELGSQSATFNAGGRYDGLAEEMGGPATPGVGFAMGLDRVLLAMESEGLSLPAPRGPTAFVVAIGDEARRAAATLVSDLRAAGVPASTAYEERPLKAQLKMADRGGAEFAAILGEKELADGSVTLRRLSDGTQKVVSAADVVKRLENLDGWLE